MCINDVELPPYSKKMEIWNSITHFLGVPFTIAFAPFAISKAYYSTDILGQISVYICLLFMLILYAGSAWYHGAKPGRLKRVLRILDHDNVFLQVMGSYLPFCWIALREPQNGIPWGWIIFGIVWGSSILGIILNSINIERFKVVSYVLQIVAGSVILIVFGPLQSAIGLPGVLMCFFAGVCYWIGAVLYAIGKRKTAWFHTVFHLFVLAGSILMFLSIYLYVL